MPDRSTALRFRLEFRAYVCEEFFVVHLDSLREQDYKLPVQAFRIRNWSN
jgi:hypothetical protein